MSNGVVGSLLERAKFFREHIQTILNLATGSLVLSVTFLHDVAAHAQHISYLRYSWMLFVVCIGFGLLYNYVLAIYVRVNEKSNGKRFGATLMFLSGFFHISFVFAIYYMLRFGIANLQVTGKI